MKRALIVDDTKSIRVLPTKALEHKGPMRNWQAAAILFFWSWSLGKSAASALLGPGRLPRQSGQAEQTEELSRNSTLQGIFQLLPYLVPVLNKQPDYLFQQRPALGAGDCAVSRTVGLPARGGCGTTAYWKICWANTAILKVQQTGQSVYRECLLTTSADGQHTESHELSVHAMPAGQSNPDAILFMIRDISEEKRKKVLEQLFLHDLLNSAGAARGFLELTHMTEDLPQLQELCGCPKDADEVIIGEIENHLNGLIRAIADSVQSAAEHTVDIRLEYN